MGKETVRELLQIMYIEQKQVKPSDYLPFRERRKITFEPLVTEI